MKILTFNTCRARQQLLEAGVPERQAIGYVELLTELIQLDIDSLATRVYIDRQLASLEDRILEKLDELEDLLGNGRGS